MKELNEISFTNIKCKIEEHESCCGSWAGLGFNITCECGCHKLKNDASEGFGSQDSGTSYQVSLETTKENDK